MHYWLLFGVPAFTLVIGFTAGLCLNWHDLGGYGGSRRSQGLRQVQHGGPDSVNIQAGGDINVPRVLIASGILDDSWGEFIVHVFADGGAKLHGGGKCAYCVPQG